MYDEMICGTKNRCWWGLSQLVFFSSRRRHARCCRDWSSDVCSSDLEHTSELQTAYEMLPSGVQTCALDRKSTRLNSSHGSISYAVFCLIKKKNTKTPVMIASRMPSSESSSNGITRKTIRD